MPDQLVTSVKMAIATCLTLPLVESGGFFLMVGGWRLVVYG